MNIMLLGAGGVGGYIGALLARAGHAITLVDRYQAHVDAINEGGLSVTGQESFTVRPTATTQRAPTAVGEVDLLVLATKNVDTAAALALVTDIPIASVTSVQNGLDVNDPLLAVFGAERVFGMVTLISGSLIGPGQIYGFMDKRPTFIGELDGRHSERVANLRTVFASTGLQMTEPDNITTTRWSKMVWWIPFVIVPALTRLSLGQAYSQRDAAFLFVRIERECAAVATALGHPPRDYPTIDIVRRLSLPFDQAVEDALRMGRQFIEAGTGGYEVAMLLDLKRRQRTEADNTAGVIVRAAERLGIPVPYTEFAWRAIRAVEGTFGQTSTLAGD